MNNKQTKLLTYYLNILKVSEKISNKWDKVDSKTILNHKILPKKEFSL